MPAHSLPFSFNLAVWAVRAVIIAAQIQGYLWLRRYLEARGFPHGRKLAAAALLTAVILAVSSDVFEVGDLVVGVPRGPSLYRFFASVWVAGTFGAFVMATAFRAGQWLRRRSQLRQNVRTNAAAGDPSQPSRRTVIHSLAGAALASPFVVAGYGTFIGRTQFEVRERNLVIPHLPEGLDGFRLLQLTDIHMGPNLSAAELERAVAMANETRPHLALVTGDLITHVGDPLEKCLDVVSGLKADAGIRGCLGNHELFTKCQSLTKRYGDSVGIGFLRHRAETLRFGGATVNLCGVDYQRTKAPYLTDAGQMLEPDAFNVLLSHNPDVFPVAADLGYDLVIGGHTHGGQVTIEIVEQWANAGRFFTPYVSGEYRRGKSVLYVSRGIGTVNLPMRVGALPEITLLRLQRA